MCSVAIPPYPKSRPGRGSWSTANVAVACNPTPAAAARPTTSSIPLADRWVAVVARWTPAADGICGDAFGIPGPLSAFAPWLVKTFDVGDTRGKTDREFASSAAGLIVVTSDEDRASLLRAGETLERLLLTLTTLGVQYSFLNQPIQVPDLRKELWTLVRTPRPPQLLLRIGYATPIRRAAPRRRVNAVTV